MWNEFRETFIKDYKGDIPVGQLLEYVEIGYKSGYADAAILANKERNKEFSINVGISHENSCV